MTTRSGVLSRSSRSTCSSWISTWSSSRRYAASVARPSGGNSEYLIGRQNGLVASVSAGRIILTFTSGSQQHDRDFAAPRSVELDQEHALPTPQVQPAADDVETYRRRQQKRLAMRM